MTARHASELEALLVDERFDAEIYSNEPLSRHTTYRIGGPVKYLVTVNSVGALMRLLDICEKTGMPWVPLGRGSNLLVADEGFDGVAVVLGRDFRACRYDEKAGVFCVGAGVALSTVVQEAYSRSLSGLEFAVGTPGSVGGAIRMNAGTREIWLGQIVASVTTYSPRTGLVKRAGSEIAWEYRRCSLAPDEMVVECELSVSPGDPFYIRGKMEGSLANRRKTQPFSEHSCGSVFKNPEGLSVGHLVEELGLKGAAVGGARISDIHGNFIVNTGSASSYDVCELMKLIQTKVYEAYGIELQPEVKFLGFA